MLSPGGLETYLRSSCCIWTGAAQAPDLKPVRGWAWVCTTAPVSSLRTISLNCGPSVTLFPCGGQDGSLPACGSFWALTTCKGVHCGSQAHVSLAGPCCVLQRAPAAVSHWLFGDSPQQHLGYALAEADGRYQVAAAEGALGPPALVRLGPATCPQTWSNQEQRERWLPLQLWLEKLVVT